MRLAIVSDVHGNLAALDAVISDLDAQAPDLVVHGGDLAVIGPKPAEVMDVIRERGWPGVLGNTDEIVFDPSGQTEQERRAPKLRDWLHVLFEVLMPWTRDRLGDDRVDWLRKLPKQWRQDRLLLVHAMPDDLWRAPMPDGSAQELKQTYGGRDADIIVYGHIHRPYVRLLGGLTVSNSGSVGLPYDRDLRASYLLIENRVANIRRVEYDLERAAHDALEVGFPYAGSLAQVQQAGRFTPPG